MKKINEDYRAITFVPVLNGAIACLHRPTKSGLGILQQQGCTVVITLQSETELPREIKGYCKQVGLRWIWVALQGANKKLLESNNTAWLIREALCSAHELLKSGERMLIHCAAGIHRTGLFTYALLRICGYDKERTLDNIRQIRQVTFERCGKSRFDLAEHLALQIMDTGIQAEIEEFKGMSKTKSIENPLVFVNFTQTHIGNLRFDCVILSQNAEEYVLGPSVNIVINLDILKVRLGQEWLLAKEAKYLPGGVSKSYKKYELELSQFLKETCKGSSRWAGSQINSDFSFILTFWPSLVQVIGDVCTQTSEIAFESIYQEILNYRESVKA